METSNALIARYFFASRSLPPPWPRGRASSCSRRCRRPQGGHRDRRAGASARRPRADRRHDRHADDQGGRHRRRRARSSREVADAKACAADAGARFAHRLAAVAARSGQGRLSTASPNCRSAASARRPNSTRPRPISTSPSAISPRCAGIASVIAQQASEGAVLAPGRRRACSAFRSRSAGSCCPARRSRPSPRTSTSCACNCPSVTRSSCARATRCSIGARGLREEGAARDARRARAHRLSRNSGRPGDRRRRGSRPRRLFRRRAHARLYRHRHTPGDRRSRRPTSTAAPGVNYVRLAGGDEVVVQPGETTRTARERRNSRRASRTATSWWRHEARAFRES